jgi:hypothetical protein
LWQAEKVMCAIDRLTPQQWSPLALAVALMQLAEE